MGSLDFSNVGGCVSLCARVGPSVVAVMTRVGTRAKVISTLMVHARVHVGEL